MIKSTHLKTDKKEFEIECDICSTVIKKEILKTSIASFDSLNNQHLSNTETALCNVCKPKFIKWVRDKYPKDCWCKHLKEYEKAQSKSEGI